MAVKRGVPPAYVMHGVRPNVWLPCSPRATGLWLLIHDTRYGPGPPGSRAMISRDEGKTWLDEVYYLDSTTFTGSYSASVVFPDNTILSICGSSQAPGSWDEVRDNTDIYAIRWRPVEG